MGSISNQSTAEPVAIIGLSCKFAGDANNASNLWKLLVEGRSAWSEIPLSRFSGNGVYHPNSEKLSTTHVRGGHFMDEDPAHFDAPFFNYSAETASTLDPQFRLQLESVYEALENAGLTLTDVAGSSTSVFAGVFFHDYKESMARDPDNMPRFQPIGTGAAMAANRISHFFDLRGASVTLDTGCSTTLVALHQAVQSLRTRQADMSIVGGSNVMMNPDNFKTMGSMGFLSPDGKSFAFDSRANGYGRGEGVATVIIKRLSDAVAAGDPIRAVIRETMLNQDGKTETITSPSLAAQEALLRDCYTSAGLEPHDTQYFEAHGTGTPTGDLIEARAIAAVLGEGRLAEQPLRVGSVKTNIGHTEPTSGLASIIKVVLSMEHGVIPPSINFEKPNPKLALEDWRLKVVTEAEPWPVSHSGSVYRASVNNFGYGGSNAHVILEQGDAWLPGRKAQLDIVATNGTYSNGDVKGYPVAKNKTKVLVLSARDEQTCQRMVSNLKEHLQQIQPPDAETYLESLVYTLGQRRTLFPWVAAHPVPYTQGLDEVVQALDSPKFKSSKTSRAPRIGMVFTGQGAQWHAMGRELIVAYPIFKASLEEAEGYLKNMGASWSLMEELCRDPETTRVNETGLSIPICVALQISLVRLLRAWGVVPTAITSHSSGEIAAAYTVGALSYRAAMSVAYHRAVLAADKRLRGPIPGGMVAVGLGAEDAEGYLARISAGQAVIACVNSPASVTVAGDLEAVAEVEAMAQQEGIFARRLRVDTGYHSHHMTPIAGLYLNALTGNKDLQEHDVEPMLDSIAFSSPVTGGRILGVEELRDPEHWVGSLEQPVQFMDAFTDMVLGDDDPSGTSVDVLLEVGPHTALGGPMKEILSLPEFTGLQLPYWGCLVRNSNARDSMQALAANLLRKGYPLDLEPVNFPWGKANHVRVLRDIPSYPWNHNVRHWFEPRVNRALRERSQPPHALLGQMIPGCDPDSPSWRHILRTAESPWLRDHVVQSNVIYPGAGYVCLAIEAMSQLAQLQEKPEPVAGYRLREVDILQALVVPDNADGVEIQTTLRSVSSKAIGTRGWRQFEISSVTADNRWLKHATGLIIAEYEADSVPPPAQEQALSGYTRSLDPDDLYSSLRANGVVHGPTFQQIKTIVQSGTQRKCVNTLVIPDVSVTPDLPLSHVVHPTTLDIVIQGAYAALPGAGAHEDSAKLPRSFDQLWVSARISSQAGHTFRAQYHVTRADGQSLEADVQVTDGSQTGGAPVLEVRGLACQRAGGGALGQQDRRPWERSVCSTMDWAPDLTMAMPAALESIHKELSHEIDPTESRLIMDLRRVCFYYILDALATLSSDDVAQLEPHHTKLYAWMQRQVALAASGQLGPDSATWDKDSLADRQQRIDETATASINGEMICHLGPHLVDILRRKVAPLELMMQRDKLLYRFYGRALKSDRGFGAVAKLLRKIVHKNPRARILEIGAGTGGATRHCLKALGTDAEGGPLAESYTFTDVSVGFFEAAREEFAPWADILTFARLDIETDPADQEGVELGGYDIVIACEVLHATRSMANTMANVRKLLKPGGTLLLLEATKDQLDVQLTFGLLPGWWLSEEPERIWTPSLSTPFWHQVLKKAGFTGVAFELRDCESDELYSLSTLLSTVPPEQPPRLPSAEDIIIVTSSKAPPPSSWSELLQENIAVATGSTSSKPAVHVLEESTMTNPYRGKLCVFVGEVEQPILHDVTADALTALQAMVIHSKGLIWVTRGGALDCENPQMSLASGFLRSLRNEYVGRANVSLDLDPSSPETWSETAISAIVQVVRAAFANPDNAYVADAPPVDFEYAERGGTILVPRCFKDTARNKAIVPGPIDYSNDAISRSEPYYQQHRTLALDVGVPGLLDTLRFGDDPAAVDEDFPADLVEIEPRAYGVNFRDVMVAMGQLSERAMGLECAGILTRVGVTAQAHGYSVGDEVFALLGSSSFSSRPRAKWSCTMHMPAGLQGAFEDAASLPVIFATAYMCLVDIAQLQRGQSVLIHAAAGGVGQAAIMLAQHLGAVIYATVGTPEKRELVESYGVPAHRIFNSRDTSFAAGIMAATKGRGVDVVLNSLSGPQLQESFNVVAPFGRFVEIGKRDLEQNSQLEMRPFTRQVSFSSYDLLDFVRHRPADVHRVLAATARLVEIGALRPIRPVTTYPIADVSRAFRLLQTGKHMGKVVLSVGPDETVPVLPKSPAARLSPHASYLIVGGVGGIGRTVANWMVSRGARHLILLSRNAAASERTGTFIAQVVATGCKVKAISCDVADSQRLTEALDLCKREGLPPVRGIIQAAMVLQDSIIEQMTIADYRAAVRPKVNGSWNLHSHFQTPGSLDFFIMLSSVAGIVGYASQSNYSAGGAYEDALARWRASQGLPAVSIDLGAVKGVGYVAETAGVAGRMEKVGHMLLPEERVLGVIESAIANPFRPQVVVGLNTGPGAHWDRHGESQLGRDARFTGLRWRQGQAQNRTVGEGGASAAGASLAASLGKVASRAEAEQLVGQVIAQKLSDIFMIPVEDVDSSKHPSQYGVDSLVAVELRNMLAHQAAAEVSIFGIMQSASLAALARDIVGVSAHVPAAIVAV
ncbi:hypothetical protein BDV10DRAFT_201827 [Aspergillus recurvatus]